jgi:hypothetical protein
MNATTATDRRVKHKFTSEIYEPSMLLNIKLLYAERVYPLQTSRNQASVLDICIIALYRFGHYTAGAFHSRSEFDQTIAQE